MEKSESIGLVEVLSNTPEETLEEWRRSTIEQSSKPNPHALKYNPRFPLEDQSWAAQEDFFHKLKFLKAEQEYFDLMEKKKKRESINVN